MIKMIEVRGLSKRFGTLAAVKGVIVYILLLVVLTVLLGLAGLLISFFVILLSEAKRGAFARPLTTRA